MKIVVLIKWKLKNKYYLITFLKQQYEYKQYITKVAQDDYQKTHNQYLDRIL